MLICSHAIIANSKTNSPEIISAAAVALAKAAAILGWPTTYSIVPEGAKQGTLLPDLQPYATPKNTFRRTITDPFLVPDIAHALSSNGRKAVVISGVSTEVAVFQTSVGAIAAGYKVYVPVDAIGSRSERTEAATLREIERAGVVTTSVRSFLLRLTPEVSRPPGNEILKALGSL